VELSMSLENKTAHLTLIGDIDDEGANKLKAKLTEIQNKDLEEVIFDFAGVKFIGSTGIGKLLLFYKSLSAKGGRLRITNMSTDLHTMFTVIKLDKIFNIST